MNDMKSTPARQPRVGIGVFIRKNNKVLMGRRKGSHGTGTWAPPGGHLDFGESFETCALREVKEETGLDVRIVGVGIVTNDIFPEGKHYITIQMIADYINGEPQIMEPNKCEEWRWCRWDDLPTPLLLSTQHGVEQGFSPFN